MNVISAVVLLAQDDVTAEATKAFEALGFDVQIVAPASLVILGEPALFEARFGVQLEIGDRGVNTADAPTRVLPIAPLPERLRPLVKAVEFDRPPEFGPGRF